MMSLTCAMTPFTRSWGVIAAISDLGGKLMCVDLESGKILWGERGFG